jgi:hypothetical protein
MPPPAIPAIDVDPRPARDTRSALRARLQGPGGYYNIGNVIGLVTGIGLQLAAVSGSPGAGFAAAATALRDHFVGSPGAVALTAAMGIFLVGGEVYHRAWARGFPPQARLNRIGDLLSALGAVVLALALVAFGQPLLAAASGILLAGGKFGSALVSDEYAPAGPASPWPARFRSAVLLSRAPAVLSLLAELAAVLPGLGDGMPVAAAVAPLSLFFCYLLWIRADLLLFAVRAR